MSERLPIKIRPITQLDVPFVFSSWLKSFRNAFFSKDIHPKTYFGNQHIVVGELLRTCTTYVACADSDSNEVYGFICGEYQGPTFVLHYIYVKHTFRNLGIATQLLAQFPVADNGVSFYTHHNGIAHKQAAAYQMLYNPYLALLHKYRKDKPKNELNVDQKIEEIDDEQEFKLHRNRGGSSVRRSDSAE